MRIMAIDYGDARTGVAISDPTGLLAGFTTVIHSRKPEAVAAELARLVRESFRLNRDTLEEGLDIIVVARAAAKDSDYKTIERAFMHLCGLHNIKKESK